MLLVPGNVALQPASQVLAATVAALGHGWSQAAQSLAPSCARVALDLRAGTTQKTSSSATWTATTYTYTNAIYYLNQLNEIDY